jgi:hypothetical protein
MPGRANMVSVISAPENRAPNDNASTVKVGASAPRSAWRRTTSRSDRPLARAVRIWSWRSTSMVAARTKRV